MLRKICMLVIAIAIFINYSNILISELRTPDTTSYCDIYDWDEMPPELVLRFPEPNKGHGDAYLCLCEILETKGKSLDFRCGGVLKDGGDGDGDKK